MLLKFAAFALFELPLAIAVQNGPIGSPDMDLNEFGGTKN